MEGYFSMKLFVQWKAFFALALMSTLSVSMLSPALACDGDDSDVSRLVVAASAAPRFVTAAQAMTLHPTVHVEESRIIANYLRMHGLFSTLQISAHDMILLRYQQAISRNNARPLNYCATCTPQGYHGVNTLGYYDPMYVKVGLGANGLTAETYQATRANDATETISDSHGNVVKTFGISVKNLAGLLGTYILTKGLDAIWQYFVNDHTTQQIVPNSCPANGGNWTPTTIPGNAPIPPGYIPAPDPWTWPDGGILWDQSPNSLAYDDDGTEGVLAPNTAFMF